MDGVANGHAERADAMASFVGWELDDVGGEVVDVEELHRCVVVMGIICVQR